MRDFGVALVSVALTVVVAACGQGSAEQPSVAATPLRVTFSGGTAAAPAKSSPATTTLTPGEPVGVAPLSSEARVIINVARDVALGGSGVSFGSVAAASPDAASILSSRRGAMRGETIGFLAECGRDAASVAADLRALGANIDRSTAQPATVVFFVPLDLIDEVRRIQGISLVRLPDPGTFRNSGGVSGER